MTTPNQQPHDDEQALAGLLRTVEHAAPPPDRAFLERLREQSTLAFTSSCSEQTNRQQKGRSLMFQLVRGLAAAVAAVILVAGGTYIWKLNTAASQTFAGVVAATAAADTAHFRLVHRIGVVDPHVITGDLWTRNDGWWRYDQSDGTYLIGHGREVWQVDEKANRANRTDAGFGGKPFDGGTLLQFFGGIEPHELDALYRRAPEEQLRDEDRLFDVYRFVQKYDSGPISIEAVVDVLTRRLVSLKKADRGGRVVTDYRELTAISYNQPIPPDKFVLKDTLTEDGRVGKVADVQGIVSLKPVLANRWSPVQPGMLLKPGDWVRTDPRGANAVALKLMKATGVVLGPGAIVEVAMPDRLKILEGELELNVPAPASVEVLGPDGEKTIVTGKKHFRVAGQKLAVVTEEPKWLKGFKGTTAQDATGSLIAKVDGRDVPLTVGYHKVAVDIRDQIARTVIEQSFVNHTKDTLEGVFYFPLPQDASISGFGMWIGNELVEADIVEKQRAREIYEEILRERRDPGLLEWAGGNIFKARVFPIFGNSEKRIKITYTQVLPLKGNRYRYSYGLQSEMLREKPLRELAIDVKINSAVPLKGVTCPTHPTRSDKTDRSAHVEFAAQAYTPTRDFEVVVEMDGRQNEVVMIPHRRGDDGYFMLQLLPPAGNGNWERELLPDGEPVQLLILADTSASMDQGQRLIQNAFLGSLFASLTPRDSVNLAACDVNCDWIFEKGMPADAKSLSAARDFLTRRVSLGWTDLDKAFASAFKLAGPKTHIIYLGDGIVTTGDANPQAFVKRLERLGEAHRLPSVGLPSAGLPSVGLPAAGVTCHAVALGNSFEPAVLKAIATQGGGSLRRVTGEQGPAAVARELLGEISQPGLRDLRVDFKNLRTARVYPDTLPNLAPGTQQILLGRYLPEGRDQVGEVTVTGYQNGKPLRFTTQVSLRDAEQGNSFIPRLWARMHLDRLLEQGQGDVIKDEVIALSEEFNIITPYTSFLVLETDADRERFKVKRRFRMRDGEKFFAEGQNNARYELTQKQMKKAGNWRLGLRAGVLRELASLGRHPQIFQPHLYGQDWSHEQLSLNFLGRSGGYGYGGPMSGGGADAFYAKGVAGDFLGDVSEDRTGSLRLTEGVIDEAVWHTRGDLGRGDLDLGDMLRLERSHSTFGSEGAEVALRELDVNAPELAAAFIRFPDDTTSYASAEGLSSIESSRAWGYRYKDNAYFERGIMAGKRLQRFRRDHGENYTQWIDTLFPHLPPAPAKPPAKMPVSKWPADVQALAQNLLRTEKLAKLQGGLDVQRITEGYDPRWQEMNRRSARRELFMPSQWLTLDHSDGADLHTRWCDGKEYGVMSHAFELGRIRAAVPEELKPPLQLADFSLDSLEATYGQYTATLKEAGKDRTLLTLTLPHDAESVTRILIDTARHVILSVEVLRSDKPVQTYRFDDFVDVAGCWWHQRRETFDEQGRRTEVQNQTIKLLAAAEFQKEVELELAQRSKVFFLHQPLPRVDAAKQAHTANKAKFEDLMVLVLHFARTQQWTRVYELLDQIEKSQAAKPGVRWLRIPLGAVSRRHEEVRKKLLEEIPHVLARGPRNPQAPDAGLDLFLARFLLGQAGSTTFGQEYLQIVEQLEPVFRRQPERLHAPREWQQYRLNVFQQLGRQDEALKLLKQLASDYPRDANSQYQYAQGLVGAGDYEAAYAWLRRVLVPEAKWLPHEEDMLRGQFVQFLNSEGRFADMVPFLEDWIKRQPESQSTYPQYLSALIRSGREEQAHQLMAQWLKEAVTATKPETFITHRLQAAVAQMLGQGYHLHTNRLDERWLGPLADAVLPLGRQDRHHHLADQIMSHHQFRESDEIKRVRKATLDLLTAEIETLPPRQVRTFAGWLLPDVPPVPQAVWKSLADVLRRRWQNAQDDEVKHQLGDALQTILSSRFEVAEHLAFLRTQHRDGPKKYRSHYAQLLFGTLLGQPWSLAFEDEAFALLPQLGDPEDPTQQLVAQIQALHQLDDAMVESRYQAKLKDVKDQHKFTRTELAKVRSDTRKAARQEFADRLKKEVSKHAKPLAQWINAERLYFDVLLERDVANVVAECWEVLGAAPQPVPETPKPEDVLKELLVERHLALVLHLATRPKADAALVDRLLKYIDQGIANAKESETWKLLKYRVLVALDRPKDLEQVLTSWLGTRAQQEPADTAFASRWKVAIAYLLAEQGKIPDAIKLFEGVETADELGPTAYRALADWYLVTDRRDKHEEALKKVFAAMPEHHMANALYGKLQPWQRGEGKLPSELDRDVLLMFGVLFEKSGSPANYVSQLQQFYQASRDFRLLAVMVDGVVGHTAVKAYPFVQAMQGVLNEIRDEAVVDEIAAQMEKTRTRAKTTVDQRILDLLELQVRRRAAELKNQPGPHRDAALAAMQRAFQRDWTDGEPRLMADFLAGLGNMKEEPLAREQLREFEQLHRLAKVGTHDRLHIAYRFATTQAGYQRLPVAIELLEPALKEYQDANQGILPTMANDALAAFVAYHQNRGHYERGEKVLLEQLRHPAHAQQARWLTLQLVHLYHAALSAAGEVSLGKGSALYKALEARLLTELSTPDHNQRYSMFQLLVNVYRTARDKKLPGVAEDVRAFAFQKIAEPIKGQTSNYESVVGEVARLVHDVLSPREGIRFLLDRIDAEPSWLRLNNQDGWQRHGHTLGEWRRHAGDLGDVEPRLLKLVLKELRRDLETRSQSNRSIYYHGNDHYWAAKEAEFLRTAEEVLTARKASPAAVQHVADYVFHGLRKYDRAIAFLKELHAEKRLPETGQAQLVNYLHERKRFDESIPLLEALVELRSEQMTYRVQLMHAFFRTQQHDKLRTLLKQTDAFFHEKQRWGEGALSALAHSTLQNELFAESIAYFDELIPLHQGTHPGRGIGNGTLSGYWSSKAQAYAGLKKTADAVDAASAAVVSWGPRHEQRTGAIQTLVEILRDAPDLDAFVAGWNQKVAKEGTDAPVLRKALGKAYTEKKQYAGALAQLRLAVELQPGDVETHQLLVAVSDKLGDKEGAIRQLLQAVELSRREIKLYEDLGKRLAAQDQSAEAERAYTSIVEMLPTESESHLALAEVRQKQNRWGEAIGHWEQVARIRALEPTGLLHLAKAQVHEKRLDEARETVKKLRSRVWPQRFGNVEHEIREIEKSLAPMK